MLSKSRSREQTLNPASNWLQKPMKCWNKYTESTHYPLHAFVNVLTVFGVATKLWKKMRTLDVCIPSAHAKQLRKFVSLWLLISNRLFEYSQMNWTFPKRCFLKFWHKTKRNNIWCQSHQENGDVHIKKISEEEL